MADDFAKLMRQNAVPLPDDSPSPSPAVGVDACALPKGEVLPPRGGAVGADAPAEFRRDGVSEKTLRDLARASPQDSADLHGMTADEAHAETDRMLARALRNGLRHVEVIHGRGLHSQGRAVLRCEARRWLERCDAVLAYCEPRKNAGATLALLRRGGERRRR